MKQKEIEYWTKTLPEKQRQAREADLPRRLAILTPEAVANWIGVIDKALPVVANASTIRPCDYSAWANALRAPHGPNAEQQDPARYYQYGNGGLADEFMSFATDASMPGWPDDQAHLVEFALRYLEADVMLFRSGYTKRHLLRRLRQARLDAKQKERAVALIKRAVTNGTGLEEFREFKQLAKRFGDDNLRDWLKVIAEGAYVTYGHYYGAGYLHLFLPLFAAGQYAPEGWFQSPSDPLKLNVFSLNVVKKGLPHDNPTKVNAWCILCHIR